MLELKIDHIGTNGDGVAYQDNQTYYISCTAPGDIVTAEKKDKRGNGFAADLVEILTPSPDRINAKCKHFGTCGGCSLQHVADPFIADWKQNRIHDALKRVGLNEVNIATTITSTPASRRRVEFVASKRKKGVMIGYHMRRSHQIFDVGDCPLLLPELTALIKPLRAMLPVVMARNSQVRLTLTATTNGPDLLITGGINIDLDVREILARFGQEQGLSRISIKNDDEKILEVVAAIKPANIAINGDEVILPPGGFLQATEEGQQTLIEKILENLPKNKSVLDLFSGCGSFSLPAAHHSKSVLAMEGDEDLVFALKNAANKKMLPLKAEYRDLFRRPLSPVELDKFDTIIIDPPRAGATAQVADIAQSNVSQILFVSCNPASFARDVKVMIDGGYELQEVTPIDQFLWSAHVELFAVLTKKE